MQGNSSATCWCDERRGKEEGTGKGGQLLNHRPRDSGYVSSHLRVGGPHDRSAYHLPSAQADDEGVVQFVSGNDDSETLHHGSQGSGFLSDMWKDIASIGPRLAEVGWTWHGDLFERGYHSSTPPALAQDSEDERVKSDSDISKNTTVSATSLDLMNEKERNNKHDAKSKGKERKERSRMKSSTIPMELTYKKDEVLPVCSGDVRSEIDRLIVQKIEYEKRIKELHDEMLSLPETKSKKSDTEAKKKSFLSQIVELKFEKEAVQKRLDRIEHWQAKHAPPETESVPIELSDETKRSLLNEELRSMQLDCEQKKKQASAHSALGHSQRRRYSDDWRVQNKELGKKLLMDSSELDRHIKSLASELNQAHTGLVS